MDIFSNLMAIGECLLDTRRTQAFARAIKKVVKQGDVVLDVGTGSGILAMLAARAGAGRVYAIDIAPDIVKFAKTNIRHNRLQKIISVKAADAKKFKLDQPVDVVTMEMLDTCLVAEQQAVAVNQLHRVGAIGPKTRLIPYRYQCAVEVVDYDFAFYGFVMPFVIQARNFTTLPKVRARLTDTVIFRDIDFHRPVATVVNDVVTTRVRHSGVANALLLGAKTFLAPGVALWGTTDMNMPVVVPLPPARLARGQTVKLRLRYQMGKGYSHFRAAFIGR